MSDSKWVQMGSVRRFDSVEPDKEQALKVLEEAAEVVDAWKDFDEVRKDETRGYGEPHDWTFVARDDLLDECADVIQATLNLVSALGVEDFRPFMKECERRNRERGRITDGRSD